MDFFKYKRRDNILLDYILFAFQLHEALQYLQLIINQKLVDNRF